MTVLDSGRRAALAFGALALPALVHAQVESITITARKKEEPLQNVPISVTAFGEKQLRELGLGSDNDVADFTVNFNTLPQTGRDYDRPVIRGMSSPPSRGEANAAYFIDGAYVSGSIGGGTTSAVERVEVLRGPQSAQFGRAAFSGAINYVTKNPTEELEGAVRTKAGTHEDYDIGGWASGPIGGGLSFLVSADWSQYGGEWNNFINTNDSNQAFNQPSGAWIVDPPQTPDRSSLGGEETLDLLAKLVWRPVEGTEVNFKVSYTKIDDETFPSLVAPPGPPLPYTVPGDQRLDTPGGNGIYSTLNCWLAPQEFYDYLYSSSLSGNPAPYPGGEQPWWRTSGGSMCGEISGKGWQNRVNLPEYRQGVTTSGGDFVPPVEPGLRKHDTRYLLEYIQDIGDWVVRARGAYNDADFNDAFDLDHTEARAVFGLFNFELKRPSHDWATELRVTSPAELPLKAEAGIYHFERDVKSTQRSFPGPAAAFGPYTGFAPFTKRNVDNNAYFGSLTWDFAEQWEAAVEMRYASEQISIEGGNGCDDSDTYYSFTPRMTLRFKPTDATMLYVQAANGDKPGDFNTEFFRGDIDPQFCELAQVNSTDVAVKPEENWTYEVGAKTRWLDDRIQANLAVFLIDWSEQSIFQTQNFASYDFPGYGGTEPTLVTTLLRNVGDSRNIGAELETTFAVTDVLTLIANYGYTHAKFQKGYDANLASLTGNGDVSGRWIPSAPEHNAVLGAVVTKPVSAETTATFRADVVYESKRYLGPSNFVWVGDRTLVNLRAGVQRNNWDVTAYVRNLMDDQTPVAGLEFVNFGYGALTPGPDNQYGTNDDIYPQMFSINPQRGRDYGLEFSLRFGAD
jgi:outer membrane receptor protein involved in Fe transport